MEPTRLMTVPCEIVSRVPGAPDKYGGDTLTESRTEARCWYSSPTTEERGGQVVTAMTGYFGPDAVLDHVARVEIEGVGSFEVDGHPLAHRSPRTGVLTHQTVRLRRGA
jgi:hypothetical protein